MTFKEEFTRLEEDEIISGAKRLLEALERMFENPMYQSVFLAAAEKNVYFAGEDISPYFNNMKELLCIPEQVEDPVVDGDENTVEIISHEEALLYGPIVMKGITE